MPRVIAREMEMNLPVEVILEALEKLSPKEKKIFQKELERKKNLVGLKKSFENIWKNLPTISKAEVRRDINSAISTARTKGK